jgi:type II secretory pathway component PulF
MTAVYQIMVFTLAMLKMSELVVETPWGILVFGVFLVSVFFIVRKRIQEIERGED